MLYRSCCQLLEPGQKLQFHPRSSLRICVLVGWSTIAIPPIRLPWNNCFSWGNCSRQIAPREAASCLICSLGGRHGATQCSHFRLQSTGSGVKTLEPSVVFAARRVGLLAQLPFFPPTGSARRRPRRCEPRRCRIRWADEFCCKLGQPGHTEEASPT